MALKIRLARAGAKKQPYYRIVVADSRSPRDGKFIEKLGVYNPFLEKDNENRVVLKAERITYWLSVGAQATDRVAKFLGHANLAPMPEFRETPLKSQPKKKAQERIKAEADAKAKAEAAVIAAAAAEIEAKEKAKAEAEAASAAASVEAQAPTEETPS